MKEWRKVAMEWRLALLGVAFALHNIEEVLRFPAWKSVPFLRPAVDQATFSIAVILLSMAVAAIFVVAARKRMQGPWGWGAAVIAGGLIVNALIHVGQSLVTLIPVPGLVSGVIGVAPTAAWVLAGFGETPRDARRQRILALLLGAAAMPVAAFGALRLAEIVKVWLV